MDNNYVVRCGSLQMVSKSILSTSVWGFVWPHNSMGYNEDVVSAWRERERGGGELGGVCDVSHWIG